MTLTTGARLGAYEILAPIGAGGMGEVYRARDAKLDRDVAVKVLPVRLAEDEEALARFEREAKAVAALSHPGILAIHDFGREGKTAYAVMELLEGETLRERLGSGALPVRKAVDWAVQVAQALAAAHEKGIVHRDLKPENVFVTREGRVKVLDFGLARREAAAAVADGSETSSPTAARPTEPGTVMGTAGYMSPEQVRGQAADARSDIFSLGAVIYEMLAGRRAFARETSAETMTAILREEPPDLVEAAAGLPPSLARIVGHCLEKRPGERFQSARDLAFQLEALGDSQVRHERVKDPAPARRLRSLAGVAGLVLLGVLAGLAAGRRSGGAAAPAQATTVSFVQITDQPGVEKEPSISPDGKSVVYAADSGEGFDLFLLRVGGRNPQNLTADSPGDDHQPVFSPDGERIAFRSERDGGGIFVMGSTGESVKRLTDSGYNPTWSPDGREIAVATGAFDYPTDRGSGNNEIWAVDVASGKRRAVTRGGDAMQPSWSPHGRRIAFWGLRGHSGQRDLWTAAADGSEAETGGVEATNDPALDWSPSWAPDGRHLYFSSTRGGTMNLWRVPIDEATGRVLGEAEPVTTPSLWSGNPGLARDGRQLVFASLDWRSTLLRAPFDPAREQLAGPPTPVLKSTQPIRDHDISPDGQWVALTSAGAREDLQVARMDGSQYRRLTDDAFRDRGASWRPDGASLAFYTDRGGGYEVWTIRPDGSGLETLLHSTGSSMNFPVWSPDGARVALAFIPGNWSLFELGAGAPAGREMPAPGPSRFWPLSWSPDGRRLAGIVIGEDATIHGIGVYELASGRYETHPFGARPAWLTPRWLSDSRRLVLRDPRGIAVVDTATWREKRLVAVGGYMLGGSVAVSRDNRFLTWTETATEGDVWMVNLQ